MFTAALFTIAKTRKQPKCLSTDEWIKKIWYIYTVEYYSAIKKNEIMPFAATWMDLDIIILSEVNQTEKDKYHDITYMRNLKEMVQLNLLTKQTHRLREGTYGYQVEGWWGGIDWEFGIDMYTLLYLK